MGSGYALIAWAEGKKSEGIRLLRVAADHEDAVDKHPVTPGALLPVREMLADLLLEDGSAAEALKEYETVLKTAPHRFNATAGAARAADRAGDQNESARVRNATPGDRRQSGDIATGIGMGQHISGRQMR